MFSAHSGVLARTLVGHESGVWGVCLVEKGGWREGGEPVKEEVGGSSNERREMKVRKKQKERQEKEDRETTPRPATAKESATVTLVIDPDSKKPRRRRDTGKDKNGEKDGEKEERKSRRPTPPNEIPIIGHIRVEANDRIRDEPSRGSSSSSHHEGLPGPSSATTATPASAGPSRTRRASPSPTTPKRPRKYPSTIPQHRVDNEFHDLSILQPVESGLAGETFPILSAGVNGSSAPTPTTAAIKDESDEAHSRHRHDTHHHHHHQQHQRRSRRNSAVNQGGPTHARNNDSANKRAEHVELNAHPPQRGSIPKGDGMHVMPGESLAHLLPAALRVALGLRAVPGGVSGDASEGSSDSEGEWGGQGRYRRRRGDSQRREEENVAVDLSGDGGERRPLGYDAKAADGNMTNASRGWGQPNALVVSGGCDKVLRVWEVKSGSVLFFESSFFLKKISSTSFIIPSDPLTRYTQSMHLRPTWTHRYHPRHPRPPQPPHRHHRLARLDAPYLGRPTRRLSACTGGPRLERPMPRRVGE